MLHQTASQAASAAGELLGKPVIYDWRTDDQGRTVFNFDGNRKSHEILADDAEGMSPADLTRAVARALL